MATGCCWGGHAMRRKSSPAVLVLCSIILLAATLCNRDYNPFSDENNARAVIATKLHQGDTVSLFSTETLFVQLAAAEMVTQVVVSIDANRYFSDTTVYPDSYRDDTATDRYSFLCSFVDTGWRQIAVTTHRRSGDAVTDIRSLYVRSPLFQPAVMGATGATVCFETASVADRDVIYHWAFGSNMVVESVQEKVCASLHSSGVERVGELWVSELHGSHASPRVTFLYQLTDSVGPQIVCVNDGAIGKDTIGAAVGDFYFRVHLFDAGAGYIASSSVNGSPFDIVKQPIYVKKIGGIDTIAGFIPLAVEATDPFFNTTRKTFWLFYDSTSGVTEKPRITILVPSRDSSLVTKPQRGLMGTIDCFTTDSFSLYLQLETNGSAVVSKKITGKLSAMWSFTTLVTETINTIHITAFDSAHIVKADTSFIIVYDPEIRDTVPPVLVDIKVGLNAAGPSVTMVENDTVSLQIIAFDEGSGVDGVSVNGSRCIRRLNGSGYVWDTKIRTSHFAGGSSYIIAVVDSAELVRRDTIKVQQNRLPFVVRYPNPPLPLIAGEYYRDTIAAVDPDQDRITYAVNSAPEGCTIDSLQGVLTWLPGSDARGIHTIAVTLRDQAAAELYQFTVRVVDTADLPIPVAFNFREQDFPSYLEVGKDTLKMKLKIADGTGEKPLQFSARFLDKKPGTLLIRHDTLGWIPQLADTGMRKITVTVTDSFANSAALYPVIVIVEPNRPFTLTYTWSGSETQEDYLHCSRSTSPETLFVAIEDSDVTGAEYFTATLQLGNTTKNVAVQNRTILMVFDPEKKSVGIDTMQLLVEDRAGHQAVLTKIVYYGSVPDVPVVITPTPDATIRDTTLRITWATNDNDTDALSYAVHIAEGSGLFELRAAQLQTAGFQLSGLTRAGSYVIKVVAHNGTSTTESAVVRFYVDPPGRVAWETTVHAFPETVVAHVDSVVVLLVVKKEAGLMPFVYSVASGVVGASITDNTFLWKPTLTDTGNQRFVIVVTDSLGNSDTVCPNIRVYALLAPPKIAMQSKFDTVASGALDFRTKTTPATLFFTIEDLDPAAAEQYQLDVLLKHITSTEIVGANREFFVVIDPRQTQQIFDTLRIIVTDRVGNADTNVCRIYYGTTMQQPVQPFPADGATTWRQSKTLSWSGNDTNTVSLQYRVAVGLSPTDLNAVGSTTLQTLQIDSLVTDTVYYWQVTVTDGVDSVMGPLWHFRVTKKLSAVRLNTSAMGIPITQTVTALPVLLRLDTSNFVFDSFISAGGGIAVTKKDGTILPVAIEFWRVDSQQAAVWVLVDTVYSGVSEQMLTINYVSGGTIANTVSNVFENFAAVWHMNNSSLSSSQVLVADASGHGNVGTGVGMASGNSADGVAASALSFGLDQYIATGASMTIPVMPPIFFEAWVWLDPADFRMTGYQALLSKGANDFMIEFNNATQKLQVGIANSVGSWVVSATDTESPKGTWLHIAGVFTGAELNLYLNGQPQQDVQYIMTINNSSRQTRIGNLTGFPERYFNGKMDEIRIAQRSMSPSWIRLSYEGVSDGSAFMTIRKNK